MTETATEIASLWIVSATLLVLATLGVWKLAELFWLLWEWSHPTCDHEWCGQPPHSNVTTIKCRKCGVSI